MGRGLAQSLEMKKRLLYWKRKFLYRLASASVEETSEEKKGLFSFQGLLLLLILVISFFILFKGIANKSYSYNLSTNPGKEIQDLQEQIKNKKLENENLQKEQELLNQEIERIKVVSFENFMSQSGEQSNLLEQYNIARHLAGFSTVAGKGIRITLQDKEGIRYDSSTLSEEIVHDADLQFFVDWMKTQEVDAIQVNGERISPMSPLLCVGSSVLVNRVYQSNPYVIETIGNAEDLVTTLDAEPRVNLMRERGLRVTIEIVENLTIEGQDDLIYVEEQIKKLKGA